MDKLFAEQRNCLCKEVIGRFQFQNAYLLDLRADNGQGLRVIYSREQNSLKVFGLKVGDGEQA